VNSLAEFIVQYTLDRRWTKDAWNQTENERDADFEDGIDGTMKTRIFLEIFILI